MLNLQNLQNMHNTFFTRNLIVYSICLFFSIPLLVILWGLLAEGGATWHHIVQELLPQYTINTLYLLAGVASFTFIIGVSTAYLCTMYTFPGSGFLGAALVLPIAIPAYISGFTWAGILDYTSPVYTILRTHLGVQTGSYLFFNILSLPGAIVIFSLALYPYVFLLCRAYFQKQSTMLFEVATSLGIGPFKQFFALALPLTRPAIIAGISLALMEVLNDYGLVNYFGVHTFTTGIFTAWFSFGHAESAMKLSGFLLLFVFAVLALERVQRGQMKYDSVGTQYKPHSPQPLAPKLRLLATLWCSLPFLAGFAIPALMLVYWTIQTGSKGINMSLATLLQNSFLLAAAASVFIVLLTLVLLLTVRQVQGQFAWMAWMARIVTIGYAIPGAVVAIGILIPLLWIENHLQNMIPALVLSGTWITLIYAYTVRYLAVSHNAIDTGLERISPTMDQAAYSLGLGSWQTIKTLHLPLLKPAITSAFILVFLDVLKELPLTLLLRPFNFDTLAVRTYEYASDERIAQAAPSALVIIALSCLPVYLLLKTQKKQAQSTSL
jgi:iron(III) transport system permease protein